MKNKTLLQHHKEWCEKGCIPRLGLCNTLRLINVNRKYHKHLIDLFEPSQKEKFKLRIQGFDSIYWGSGCEMHDSRKFGAYTELRQNIVLLLCAINNEL